MTTHFEQASELGDFGGILESKNLPFSVICGFLVVAARVAATAIANGNLLAKLYRSLCRLSINLNEWLPMQTRDIDAYIAQLEAC